MEEKKETLNKGQLVVYNGMLGRVEMLVDTANGVICKVGTEWIPEHKLRVATYYDVYLVIRGKEF